MAAADYNELITTTFRDNAIRSVMMIDDDFIPYDRLCDPALSNEKRIANQRAASIHHFFQNRKIICDVDDNANHINWERIRKCDLVILDYHLEHERPEISIQLIKTLSKTEHMNLVVVYTREDLEKTWLQIGSCLLGSKENFGDFGAQPELQKFWNDETDTSGTIPSDWTDQIENKDIASYILNREATKDTAAWFEDKLESHGIAISKEMCEREIQERNVIKTPLTTERISGNCEQKWLQTENVFIVLHKKSVTNDENDANGIWDSIRHALIDWQPSYYRLLISEMQNRLENEPISFKTNLEHDLEGQAAWLHQILAKTDETERQIVVDQLLDRLTDELKARILDNGQLQTLINNTCTILTSPTSRAPDKLLQFVAEHVKLKTTEITSLKQDLGHALNLTLCSESFDGDYITNGTVLYDADDETKWYLCVAPACETVPLQLTGQLAERLQPHRFMKVLVLANVGPISKALKNADRSNHIFIKDRNGKRIALEVVKDSNKQPSVDYILVKNHKSSTRTIASDGMNVLFLDVRDMDSFEPKETKLIPIFQLRDMYAARFQAVASHHTGRVGVDFVNF
jgi:hypothetical protein